MADERPRDVRESLSELERRLLELERDLRADAVSDAVAARPRAPVPGPPSPAATTITAEREAVPTGAVREAAQAGAGGRADIGPLVDDTRRKVDALRTSLDGLSGASDRLRAVAQIVVEDHGRALVRLERATGQHGLATRMGAPPEPAVESPPTAPVPPAPAPAPAPEVVVPEEPEPARTPEPPRPAAPRRGRFAWARRRGRSGWPRRREVPWPVLALIATGLTVAAFVALTGDDEPTRTTPTVPGAMSRIALTPELGPDTRAFASVPGTRPASDAGAINDICDGVVGGAVIVRPAAGDEVPACRGLVTVTSGTISAQALAERSSGGARPCVDAANVPAIAAARPNRELTAARDRAVQRATDRAERQVATSQLTPGERAGRVHTAAFEAGRAFDQERGLRLLAVRPEPGRQCVVPGRDDVASGRYPLAARVELIAMQASLDQLAIDRAAAVIGALTRGPAPVSATVVRLGG